MDPDIGTSDIDAVETAPVCTADSHIVGFAIGDSIQHEVKHGCVDKGDVVHGEVVSLLET